VGLVRRTKRAQQKGPNEDYAQCRTNTWETVASLQKGEAPRFAHLPLFSLSLFLTSLWTLLYLWTMDGTHTLFVSSLFLLFFLWLEVSLFSFAWSTSKLGIDTHSHNAGSSVWCFATLRKPLSKDKVTKGREVLKEEKNLRVQSRPALAGVWADFSRCAGRL
jgi:hypothetical protein